MDEPLRIVMVINSLGAGGAERMAISLANELARRGHQPTILAAFEPGPFADELSEQVALHSLDLPKGRIRRGGALAMWRALRRLRPDALVGFLYTGNRHGLVLGRLAGARCVISSLQNVYPSVGPRAAALDRLCFRAAHVGVAISTAVRDFYRDAWHFPARKLVIVPNAVPVNRFPCRDQALRQEVRAELSLSEQEVACVTVASLTDQKGYPFLIAAAAQVAARHPRLKWFLVGRGHLRESLEQQVAEVGLTDRIHFLGVRTDVPRLLQGMDLFTLPSLWEGFGIATAEAMATGLPVVATDVDGTREVVAPGETGWLVPPRDAAALAAAWEEALSDLERARAWGLRGRQRVEERFDITPVTDQFLSLAQRVMAGQPAAPHAAPES